MKMGGVIQCKCGKRGCPKKDGKAVRNYHDAIFHVASEGYRCPSCGEFYDHIVASEESIRHWGYWHFPSWKRFHSLSVSYEELRLVVRGSQ